MYNFTKEQLVKFYVEVLGYSREETESCTDEQLSANLLSDKEVRACAEYNGVKEQ
jgi:peroxiredoxin